MILWEPTMRDYACYVPNNHNWHARRKRGLIYWMIFWLLLGVMIGLWLSGGLDPGNFNISFRGKEKSYRPWPVQDPAGSIEPIQIQPIIDFKSIT